MNALIPKAMDVYSEDKSVDFNMAAYCRGHKFSPEAVNLARAIRAKQAAEHALAKADENFDHSCDELAAAIRDLRAKMERDPL